MINKDLQRVIEIREAIAARSGKAPFRSFEEIPGLGPSEKPTKWLYYFREKYLFIEGGLHESGTHLKKSPQEAEGLLKRYGGDMMVTAVTLKGEALVLPEILKGRDGLHIIEVKSIKALSDQIFADTTVRIPVTELE